MKASRGMLIVLAILVIFGLRAYNAYQSEHNAAQAFVAELNAQVDCNIRWTEYNYYQIAEKVDETAALQMELQYHITGEPTCQGNSKHPHELLTDVDKEKAALDYASSPRRQIKTIAPHLLLELAVTIGAAWLLMRGFAAIAKART
jgi:hypothetical protein